MAIKKSPVNAGVDDLIVCLLEMLPLAYSIGSGADILKPLAIAVVGTLTISVLTLLLATPTLYYFLKRNQENKAR